MHFGHLVALHELDRRIADGRGCVDDPRILEVSDPSRRLILRRGMVAALGGLFAGLAAAWGAAGHRAAPAFEPRSGWAGAATRAGRAVVYAGGDGRTDYLFKFVDGTEGDAGTLWAARFESDGGGRWLPVDGIASPVVPRGATRLGPRRWLAVDAARAEVYCPLQVGPSAGRTDLIKWREAGDLHGERFVWNHFVLDAPAGDPSAWSGAPVSLSVQGEAP